MNTESRKSLAAKIEVLRREMVELARQEGLHSANVLAKSKELDALINQYNFSLLDKCWIEGG
ncbi:Spo0E family sporulation regulatory protein-aspartic acid phosphatase [Paenibacillus sp. 1P07SE]|uniref:Spo0E family sporulation regulatory protein-aspartic acid phosphatase n=1 Tax=Paenibacillus sp. 1P07SE TaxID=3132209 RepID=UPI0039A4977B